MSLDPHTGPVPTPAQVSTTDAIKHACLFFIHYDRMNAAVHTSQVRYSPITFRMLEVFDGLDAWDELTTDERLLFVKVRSDAGQYPEDPGR